MTVEQALSAFNDTHEWNEEFDGILSAIADNGVISHQWQHVRELIRYKVKENMKFNDLQIPDENQNLESTSEYITRISHTLDLFDRPPFTIQRLCELAVRPTQHHKSALKYLRAVEKVLLVTSYDDEFHRRLEDMESSSFEDGGEEPGNMNLRETLIGVHIERSNIDVADTGVFKMTNGKIEESNGSSGGDVMDTN